LREHVVIWSLASSHRRARFAQLQAGTVRGAASASDDDSESSEEDEDDEEEDEDVKRTQARKTASKVPKHKNA
jgi:hypothetical protein